jgi:hypothetical protein
VGSGFVHRDRSVPRERATMQEGMGLTTPND